MLPLDQLSQVVKEHLGLYSFSDGIRQPTKWTIGESQLGGRGLIATEDIAAGEVLFVDHSLINGPRAGRELKRGCTVCYRLDCDTFFKCSKCALLLCSEQCQETDIHYSDCAIISGWAKKVPIEEVDDTLMSRALTAIRALSLNEDQKQFMASLQAHALPQHGTEVRDLKQFFELTPQDEELMNLACYVLDANAFQIGNTYRNNEMGMRGLFPVAALLNHCCVPNTRYSYNSDLQMVVKAVKAIPSGFEICTCYTGLLWGTTARRTYLYKTKHFWCKCDRCADPTERGTMLSALKCFVTDCPGSLLPIEPLKPTTAWRCLECDLRVPYSNICAIQGAIGSLVSTLNFDNVDEMESFLLNRIIKYIPKSNLIVADLQCRLIFQLGEAEGLHWHELSESRLSLKESLCRSTLRTLAALCVGDAHLRGMLLYHLHAALAERARRHPHLYEELKCEIESTIEQAYNILHGDISAPPDLELRRRYIGPDCDKPPEERFFLLNA